MYLKAVCIPCNVARGCVYILLYQQEIQLAVCTYGCTLAVALSRSEAVQCRWLACSVCQVTQGNTGRV